MQIQNFKDVHIQRLIDLNCTLFPMTVLFKNKFKAYVTVAYCYANQQNNTEPSGEKKSGRTSDNLGLMWEIQLGNSAPLSQKGIVHVTLAA